MGFLLRSCCLCISPKTASYIIGSLGIFFSCILVAQISIFLKDQTFYITEFARSQRDTGNYLDDDQVPAIITFSSILYTVLLCMSVAYIFICIFLLVGVATKRYQLMMPWLVYMFLAMLVVLTLVISCIIGLPDYTSLAVFLVSSPFLLTTAYIWMVVASAYKIIKAEKKPDMRLVNSASQSSLDSLKGGIQRVLGGTPPPPYQAVRTDAGSPSKCRRKYARQISNESNTSDTVFFDVSSTRRSSEMTPSTKPASPIPLHQQLPYNSSAGGVIQQFNPGSQQQVGSYQQHYLSSGSTASSSGSIHRQHSAAGSSKTSLEDQQRGRQRCVPRQAASTEQISQGMRNSSTLPHLQPLHKALEGNRAGLPLRKSTTSHSVNSGVGHPGPTGCRRASSSNYPSLTAEDPYKKSRDMIPGVQSELEKEKNPDEQNHQDTKQDQKELENKVNKDDQKKVAQDEKLMKTWSSISDATSSISTTSLDSNLDTTNILV